MHGASRRAAALLLWLRVSAATCPNLCSGHGKCNIFSRCECWDGWTAGDCSEYKCPYGRAWTDMPTAIDAAHAEAECSNRGVCDARDSGLCECFDGYTGDECSQMNALAI